MNCNYKLREAAKKHQIEEVGEQLRKMRSWLPAEKQKAAESTAAEPKLVNA